MSRHTYHVYHYDETNFCTVDNFLQVTIQLPVEVDVAQVVVVVPFAPLVRLRLKGLRDLQELDDADEDDGRDENLLPRLGVDVTQGGGESLSDKHLPFPGLQ